MKLAIVQTNPIFGQIEENVHAALALMKNLRSELYVLPELFNTGYNFSRKEEVAELSETDSGVTMQLVHEFAKSNSCYVVYGYAEKVQSIKVPSTEYQVQSTNYKEQEKKNLQPSTVCAKGASAFGGNHEQSYFNSSALVGPNGLIGVYRKVHLYYREKLFFTPGNLGFPVFELPFGKVGMMICYDWIYPESARSLALQGAQLIAHPANLVLPYCPDAMITRCLENRVYAATANRVGVENRAGVNLTYIGTSQIVSNKGKILTRCCDDKPEIAVVEVDVQQAGNKRLNEFNDMLADRRPEQYHL
ncbi:MAG: acyltransferase [Ignavibacteriales bacterium]|nr:acyltransferase [Ignavibacteriales bacterium]